MTVNYDRIAPHYHQRYATGSRLSGIATALHAIVRRIGAQDILEAGCGTGRWLDELRPVARSVTGLDLSRGMLAQAQNLSGLNALACGRATQLPFAPAAFDLVFCVNALHHFGQPDVFIAQARRLLRPGGALAIANMDPHRGTDRWYLYDYFEGARETDLRRFPSSGVLLDWLAKAGFDPVEWQVIEKIKSELTGRAVLDDHFLQKHGTSQLALLSDEVYAAGRRAIESAIARAEANGQTISFMVDVSLVMITGFLPAGGRQ
ncbi:MAG TPA: class I SAM-dependent methyltransferase [Anaerolineales bacterium]|nr:class I SAM-dependent methyltransferase [Anaerolineales bacterium]